MVLEGKVKQVFETKTVGSNGFQKREVVLTTEEQYPQSILVEFVQDKCALLDQVRTGDSVKININIRGREWINAEGETRFFNSIQGWRIEKVQIQTVGSAVPPPPSADSMPPEAPTTSSSTEVEDDLPF